jgi:hypothetical protein
MDAVTAANYKAGVTAAGVANGINLVFTLPTPVASTEMIFVNGVLQQRGAGNDYQINWGYSYFRGWKTAHCFKCNCNLFRIII